MPLDIRETRVGQVVSDRMQKTVVVAVKVARQHLIYGKALRRTHKYKVHDEHSQCRVGDTVRIAPCRPLSREKRWWVMEVLSRKGEAAAVRPVEEEEDVAMEAAAAEATTVGDETSVERAVAGEALVSPAEAADAGESPATEEAA